MATAPMVDNLYKLNCIAYSSLNQDKALHVKMDQQLWHRRMGHSCLANLNKVKQTVTGTNFIDSGNKESIAIPSVEDSSTLFCIDSEREYEEDLVTCDSNAVRVTYTKKL